MNVSRMITLLASMALVLLFAACQPVTAPSAPAASAAEGTAGGVLPTDPVEDQIANAMSAAPMAIAKDATIIGFPVEGEEMVLLREGTNGWTCLTDWPASPANDPMCNDPVWTAWMDAYHIGEDPDVTQPGLSYMLQGGDDTSNVDPFAPVPAEGEEWVTSPAHLMLLLPGKFDSAVFTTDHESGFSYIMWDETPFEHLMIPVVPAETESSGHVLPTDPVEDQIANAMSAAPMAIAKDATIIGFPVEGEEMVLLREGTNGWTCLTDWPASPANDPMCNDPVWTAWMDAYHIGEDPDVTQPGLSYMLQGGDDTSNVDPFAPVPAEGEEWVTSPAHLMLLLPGNFDSAIFTTDHESGFPYIMWDETPFEHLMIPVDVSAPVMSGEDMEAVIDVEEEAFLAAVWKNEEAFATGDVDRLMEVYADDAVSIAPGYPPTVGKDAIEADLRGFFDEYEIDREFKLVGYEIDGDYGTRLGEWTQVVTPKAGGDSFSEVGHCILGFKKIDGEWKEVWEIWNYVTPES